MRTTDNRNMSDVESYMQARIEVLQAEVKRLTLELEEAQSIINSIAAEIGV